MAASVLIGEDVASGIEAVLDLVEHDVTRGGNVDRMVRGWHPAHHFHPRISERRHTERHIRFLASLAFVSPAIIAAIYAGRVAGDLTISALARNLPKDWAKQDARIIS